MAALMQTSPKPELDHGVTLWKRLSVPQALLATVDGHTFGGDLRIGDLNGDGRCECLIYRCNHGSTSGPAMGGHKPCFLGAFDLEGNLLWQVGSDGTHPVRPMSVALYDITGDGADNVICFWHRPAQDPLADWRSLADVVVQIRDGRTGAVLREAAPSAITERRCPVLYNDAGQPLGIGRQSANWVHQRILIANFRGLPEPRDLLVKLGDTYVAMDDELNVLWTYTSPWVVYAECPAYIPAVGDLNGDGRDEVNGGYFVLDADGQPLWERQLGSNMDSVTIAPWDNGTPRAICSGLGYVLSAEGETVLCLGEEQVPHGQEVRIGNFLGDRDGMEMVIRHQGHNPDVLIVNSEGNDIVGDLRLNPSPTNVGMCEVYLEGDDRPALLYNGGWLWDLATGHGTPLPDLPPPNGGDVHRMGFYHVIPAKLLDTPGEELVIWDPTGTEIFIYSATPEAPPCRTYQPGPRQYNPRIMD